MSNSNVLSADLQRRSDDDFRFMVVCASKGNMSFYHAFKDATLQADIDAFKSANREVVDDEVSG
jgi:hypothetical protein